MMATQALGNALKTNMSKQPSMTAGETYMQSVEPTLKELKGAEEEKMKAEKEKAIFTGESESRRQQALSKATEAEATAMREDPARAQYEGLIQEKSKAEFIPTQENAKDMAALFSLMNVIGFAIGAGGKQHAQQAMSAMNGMLEGHQKGRDDLYRQQRNIFETNQKQLDKKIEDLFKFMQENTKLYARDKVAAEQNANAKFAEEGAGFLKTYYEKYGPGPALEYMKQIVKAKEHAADLTDREKTRAQQAADRLQREREASQAKIEAAKEKAAAKTDKATQQQMMAQRAVNSLGGVSSALESIKELPAGTTTGLLPNLQTKDGLLNYVRNNIGRKVTSREAEILNTLFTGVGRNLASIEASGAATGLAELSKQMQSGIYINAGTDDPYKVAIKLADIRRIATENIRPAIESGLMPKQQAEVAAKLVERIEKAIPYTTADVVRAATQGRVTLGEKAEQAVTGGQKPYDPEKEARYQKWLKENPQ
jgi:hypothetical protein